MFRSVKVFLAFMFTVLMANVGFAKVQLPAVFGDNMVIQRQTTVRIWGHAVANARVFISGSCMVSPVDTQADNSGWWSAQFKSKPAGGPYTLTIKDGSDNTTVELENVLCGEVWLCSGQSNMEWSLRKVDNYKDEIAKANYPNIRLFHIPKKTSPDKQTDVDASWQVCSSQNIANFSAVGYFFGQSIHTRLDVPVGLIESAWGGSKIDAWIPTEGYHGLNNLEDIRTQIKQKTPGSENYKKALRKAIEKVRTWQKKAAVAMDSGCAVDNLSAVSLNLPQGNHGIQGLYNAMIHPIVPFTVKGALWYQGESNLGDGMLYYEKMKALTGGWRQIWGQGEFPFYFVHLAPYRYGGSPEALQLIWEAQLYSLNIPNTGMAVTSDIGNYNDIHPKNKQDVGKRLALWALAKDYGKEDIVYSGPIFNSAQFKDGKAIVVFDHSGSGLVSRDGKTLDWFEIAGNDGKFYPAQARISGKATVTVWADKVTEPKIVRLGWDKSATPNLMNKEKLPTPAFSSDIKSRLLPQGKNYALNKPFVCSNPNTHGKNWKQGLTNGSWAEDSLNCFASNEDSKFPKNVTIDLENTKTVSNVYIGVPSFGSTKTVQLELSTDGKDFEPIGKHIFTQRKKEKVLIAFKPQQARYVRIVYLDHYSTKAGYNPNFVFTTEIEVYNK